MMNSGKYRVVPEEKIKELNSIQVRELFAPNEEIDFAVRRTLDAAGQEIARKLFEFNKLKITKYADRIEISYRIEVIVP